MSTEDTAAAAPEADTEGCFQIDFIDQYWHRALAGPWKSLNFFPDFQGLEIPWKPTWSLKVLELDFLKRGDRTSDCYHQMRFLGSNVTEMRQRSGTPMGELTALPRPLTGFEGATSPAHAYKSAGLL